jgi:hypothetical protein
MTSEERVDYCHVTMPPDDPAFQVGFDRVNAMLPVHDGRIASAPMWFGWAIREAFWAGVLWAREQERRDDE